MADFISGIICYAKINEPQKKYQSEEKEFSLDLVVDKATFKAWGKQFPKQKGKTVDNEDFEEIFKIKPPFADQDEQCILKFKRPAQYKDGKPLPKNYWPKALLPQDDGTSVPLEEGVLIANGSRGKVSYDVISNDFGTFVRLRNILVESLVEYKKLGGDPAVDFGLKTKSPVQESSENKPTNSSGGATRQVDDFEEDIPFNPLHSRSIWRVL